MRPRWTLYFAMLALTASAAGYCHAQAPDELSTATPVLADSSGLGADPSSNSSPQTGNDNFFQRWFSMVSATQAEQPHWITPVVTVTPRLEQEFRFDLSRQVQPMAPPCWRTTATRKDWRLPHRCDFAPVDQTPLIGRQLVWNSVAQYRVWSKIWPEAEVNHTYFSQGPSDDKTEVSLTPGIVVGRFRIHDRLGFTIGTRISSLATTSIF